EYYTPLPGAFGRACRKPTDSVAVRLFSAGKSPQHTYKTFLLAIGDSPNYEAHHPFFDDQPRRDARAERHDERTWRRPIPHRSRAGSHPVTHLRGNYRFHGFHYLPAH